MTTSATPTVAPTIDHAPGLDALFALDIEDGEERVVDIDGEIPPFIDGRYLVNGPGRFHRGDVHYGHWLDGDGLVVMLDIAASNGSVRCVRRFVESDKLRDENAAGRALYRTFGTRFEGDQLVRGIALASPVNVNVMPFAGKLLAFGEQGLPIELDAATLGSLGEHTFGRRLNPISPFAAHPSIDRLGGELVTFGVSFSAQRPLLHLYRFDADGAMLERRRLELDHPYSIHDFALAPHHAVFYLSPYLVDMQRMADGGTVLDALSWQPELGSRLRIVGREPDGVDISIPIGSGYCLHLVGAFEQEDRLVVDVIELDRPIYDQYSVPEIFTEPRGATPVRYTVDVEAGELVSRREFAYHDLCDFPAIDPRRAQLETERTWLLGISKSAQPGRKFFDQLVCLDWRSGEVADVYSAPPGRYLGGEPVFVPDPDQSGAGAIISQCFEPHFEPKFEADSGRSGFLIFDADALGQGPVATLWLRQPVHLGFHATFWPRDA